MFNAVIGLRLKQQLALTPRLQQSVKLLQLSALDCVEELHQAMALNPFLEDITDTPEGIAEEESAEEPAERDFENPDPGSASSSAEEIPDWTEWTASPASLQDSLRDQLLLLGLSERDF